MKSRKRQHHEWVAVAAREFMKIIRHLGFRSINQASQELHINYRTLKKLDERHPDPTLTLEKMMAIWSSLGSYVAIHSRERAVEEWRLIADSLMCIAGRFNHSSSMQGIVGDADHDLVGAQKSGR